jgi:hypothetical protein
MNKVHQGLFYTTSNEVIWPSKKSNFMHGLKVPFWQFFRNWLIGWIGHALVVQPSISVLGKKTF